MSGRVLIFDDAATSRLALEHTLTEACYTVMAAATLADLPRLARESPPEAVLLNIDGDRDAALAVCRELRRGAETASIQIVAIYAGCDPETRLLALKAGAADVMSAPLCEDLLLACLRRLMRQRGLAEELGGRDAARRAAGFAEDQAGFQARSRVALIAGDGAEGEAWRLALRRHCADRLQVMSRSEALAAAITAEPPDAFVIAAADDRPIAGLNLLSELRSRAKTRNSVIVMVFGDAEAETLGTRGETAAIALDLGASDVLSGGFGAEELAVRLRAQIDDKRQADSLRLNLRHGLELAVRDPLTGLYNRRHAAPYLEQIAARAWRDGTRYAVMLLDLDRFKQVNDTYGHAAGDAVLVEVAARLRQNMRGEDLVARVGGEEFLVAMPETELADARRAAQRIGRTVRSRPIALPGGAEVNVTLSIGVAMGGMEDYQSTSVTGLLERADLALYGAKADGRDQITISRPAA